MKLNRMEDGFRAAHRAECENTWLCGNGITGRIFRDKVRLRQVPPVTADRVRNTVINSDSMRSAL